MFFVNKKVHGATVQAGQKEEKLRLGIAWMVGGAQGICKTLW